MSSKEKLKNITYQTINEVVDNAGLFYIGHFGCGFIKIRFNSAEIEIPWNNQNILSSILSTIFEIDSENGIFLDAIKGKYCRLLCDGVGNIIAIQHIVDNNRIIYMKDIR